MQGTWEGSLAVLPTSAALQQILTSLGRGQCCQECRCVPARGQKFLPRLPPHCRTPQNTLKMGEESRRSQGKNKQSREQPAGHKIPRMSVSTGE